MLSVRRNSKGFTLIEVLVAVLVLAIGLLGAAGLQLTGLRYNQSAYLRSQATAAMYDIVEKMRANPEAVESGLFNSVDSSEVESDTKDCLEAACAPSELADFDIKNWADRLVKLLPEGKGTVTYDTATKVYTVSVSWTEAGHKDESADVSADSVSMNVRL